MKNSSVTDCKQIFWHQDILGFHEGSSLLIYGQAKALEDLNPPCVTENIVFMKVTVLKVTKDTKDEVIQEPVMTNTEDPSAAGMNTKKYLTKVGKAVMPSMIQKETIKIPLQEKTDEKTDEKSTERLDKNQAEKYSMELQNPVAKPVLSGDVINMIITENRLQNTELRLSVMKMNDKLDSLLLEQQRNIISLSASNNSNNEENIKKAMNKMFKQLKSVIDPNETYTGQEVVKLVATCVKNSIE